MDQYSNEMKYYAGYLVELVRFQNSSVSVLNFKQDPVPVSIGSSKCLTFGFTVLTVFNFLLEYLKIT